MLCLYCTKDKGTPTEKAIYKLGESIGLIKEEIQAAVLKAELATEEQIPNVVLESPKDKTNCPR